MNLPPIDLESVENNINANNRPLNNVNKDIIPTRKTITQKISFSSIDSDLNAACDNPPKENDIELSLASPEQKLVNVAD